MELNTVFVLKAFQKDNPFTILTITLIVVSIFFGIILRYFELYRKLKFYWKFIYQNFLIEYKICLNKKLLLVNIYIN